MFSFARVPCWIWVTPALSARPCRSRRSSVIVVQATEHRERNDIPTRPRCLQRMLPWRWYSLLDALVWSCVTEVGDVCLQRMAKVLLANIHEMIQAVAADAPGYPLGGYRWRTPAGRRRVRNHLSSSLACSRIMQ